MTKRSESTQTHPLWRYLVVAAALQIVWGLVPSASKYVIDEIPVQLYMALRWTISGSLFAAYLGWIGEWRPLARRDVLRVSLLGILGYGVASFGSLYGLKLGGVINFSLVAALSPVIVTLLAIAVLGERPKRLFLWSLPIAIAGLVVLVLGKSQVAKVSLIGLSTLLIVVALTLEALAFVYSKRFRETLSVPQYLAISQLAAASVLWLSQLTVFHQIGAITHLTAKGAAAIIFVSLVACVLCYAVLYWLLEHVDGHRLALFDGVHSLSATFFGKVLFDEPMGWLVMVGGLLILAGLVVGNLSYREVSRGDFCG